MPNRPSRRDRRIAIFGNDEALQEVIREILELAGHRPRTFPREIAAIGAAARFHPEAIVLDPGLAHDGPTAGWELLRALRGHATLGMVPVLVCSGDLPSLRDRADALAADSMVAALEKPFEVTDLERAVADLLDGTPIPGWDDATDLVLVADADAVLIDASDAALRLLGMTADELLGRPVDTIVGAGEPWTQREWNRFREEGRWDGRVTLVTADGRSIPAVAHAQIITVGGRDWNISRIEPLAASAVTSP